ncbi:hypothetical protein [Phycicoccus flavus]|uniref:hypothetical protein n=1 Tax=Phycicoccus flavus TaxID=2502783 RepID=UPI000FEB6FE5|nr:hypothetical protein [Phycicoccus flavus]NHA68048.1 hypothetical protein [Phycicoccus flavus]
MSRTVAVVLGVLCIAMGLLWTFQGLGYVGGSPMTGVTLWAVVGPVLALAGLALVVVGGRARRRE